MDINVTGPPGQAVGKPLPQGVLHWVRLSLDHPNGLSIFSHAVYLSPVHSALCMLVAHSPARPLKQSAGIQDAVHNPQALRKEKKERVHCRNDRTLAILVFKNKLFNLFQFQFPYLKILYNLTHWTKFMGYMI